MKIKLNQPEKCPFCGSPLIGGGTDQAYYSCGSHIWISWDDQLKEWCLKGHPGTCEKKVNRMNDLE